MGFWRRTRRKQVIKAEAGRMMVVRAKFDAAQTTPDNRRHWANADLLSADAAASADVRQTLRNRARYEVANNSYARGVVLTLANDTIGTGPRLQLLTDDLGVNGILEDAFASWSRAVRLAEKLHTARMARAQDGESFLVMFDNKGLGHDITLDLRLIEADQVTTPTLSFDPEAVDGIVFDSFGNPKAYHVLKHHPGGGAMAGASQEYATIKADGMIHWFRADRPGQHRGIPEITPALPLFAQLRRYTLAVIGAAESAANLAVLMKTNAPAGGEAAEVEPMTEMEFAPNMAVFTPEGWEPSQIKAEQPATTYDMFKREILNEIARCLNMPYNIVACNSSGYNYSSGRLDHQTYYKAIRVDQARCEQVVLDRLFAAWLAEAVRVYGLRLDAEDLADMGHTWFWDGHEHVDPAKEATAQATRLGNHTTTLAAEYARQGKDWEVELRQRAAEVALMKELGLTLTQAAPGADTENKDEDEEQETPRPKIKENSRAA